MDNSNGWIRWGGGLCPVPFGTIVDIKMRDGTEHYYQQAWGYSRTLKENKITDSASRAGSAYWVYSGGLADIVAYRVVSKPIRSGYDIEMPLELGILGEQDAIVTYDRTKGSKGSSDEMPINADFWLEKIVVKGVDLMPIIEKTPALLKSITQEVKDYLEAV